MQYSGSAVSDGSEYLGSAINTLQQTQDSGPQVESYTFTDSFELTEGWISEVGLVETDLTYHLDPENTASYPGTGTDLFDLTSNGYDHTLVGGASKTTVDGQGCIDVASNTYRIQRTTADVTLSAEHTLIVWARCLSDAEVSTWRTLWRTSTYDHPMLIQDSTDLIGFYDNNTNTFASYGFTLGSVGADNTWTCFTLVASGGNTTLYINDGTTNGTVVIPPLATELVPVTV